MNDALYELLVTRKPKPYDMVVRILVILLIIAVAIGGMPFIGMTSFLVAGLLSLPGLHFFFSQKNLGNEFKLLYLFLLHISPAPRPYYKSCSRFFF